MATMQTLGRAYALLMRAAEWVLILLTAVLALIVPTGVFFRYVLGAALPWTDELGGFLLAWITYLGCVVALHRGSHLGFDNLVQAVPALPRKVILLLVDLMLAAFFAIIAVYGTQVSVRLLNQQAVSMALPVGLVYSVLPASGVLMLVVLVARYTGVAAAARALAGGGPASGHGAGVASDPESAQVAAAAGEQPGARGVAES